MTQGMKQRWIVQLKTVDGAAGPAERTVFSWIMKAIPQMRGS
jgi:hypothetical protein